MTKSPSRLEEIRARIEQYELIPEWEADYRWLLERVEELREVALTALVPYTDGCPCGPCVLSAQARAALEKLDG